MVKGVQELVLVAIGSKLRDLVLEAKHKWVSNLGDKRAVGNETKELMIEPIVVFIPNTTVKTMELAVKLLRLIISTTIHRILKLKLLLLRLVIVSNLMCLQRVLLIR